MKKLSLVAFLATLGFSANINMMPYGGYIDYSSKALKDNGIIGGVYLSYFESPFKLELDAEATKITYKDNTPDWKQKDLTGVFHYYEGYNWDFKVGIHNIFIDQDRNDNNYNKVLFGGILYYEYLKYNVGIDYYYSDYDGFNVSQITPKVGFNFGDYNSLIGSFYTEIKVNYINISDKDKAGTPKDNYTNVDLKLQNYQGKWMIEIYGSLGKNAYKVANDGFVVYNLGEEYKNSAGVNANYYFDKTMSFKFGFSRSKYEVNNNNAYANIYTISLSKSF